MKIIRAFVVVVASLAAVFGASADLPVKKVLTLKAAKAIAAAAEAEANKTWLDCRHRGRRRWRAPSSARTARQHAGRKC